MGRMSGARNSYKLGTRGSLLARTQSEQVARSLEPFLEGRRIELVIISTAGDRQQEQALVDAGGKGLFVKEIEEALLDGRIDFAVHSAKDMPAEMPDGLTIATTPRREAPNDVWIGHAGRSIAELPQGATVGTTSLRRQAQLLAMRPDLKTTVFRGNIDTRLRKVREGQVAGTFLAAAGLIRTGLMPKDAIVLPTDQFVPAAGQGILAVQCRTFDSELGALLAHINDAQSKLALMFERQIVAALAGDCLAPIGVCAQPRAAADRLAATAGRSSPESGNVAEMPGWIVRALVGTPDGRETARSTLMNKAQSPRSLVKPLLDALESRGARRILAQRHPQL
jgi:hydroxymethylbilane synthase